MSSSRAADGISHLCLQEVVSGTPLTEARLNDRQRIGVLFQGLALLAVLRQARWRLEGGWTRASISSQGLLLLPQAVPGADTRMPQELLRDLCKDLFGNRDRIPGRGQSRRIAGRLLSAWRQELAPLRMDREIDRMLQEAPFLWDPAFGQVRRCLVASLQRGDGWALWVAGGQAFRQALLAVAETREDAEALLESGEARHLGASSGFSDPAALAAAGHGSSALEAWKELGDLRSRLRRPLARALFAQGQFAKALEVLSGSRSVEARILKVRCQRWLNQLKAAAVGLRSLEKSLEGGELPPQKTLEAAEVAVEVFANLQDWKQHRGWTERALAAAQAARRADPGASRELELRAHLLAAAAAWDRDSEGELAEQLAAAEEAASHPELAWRWHVVKALEGQRKGDGQSVAEHLGTVILRHRRRLRRFDAAVVWNDLGIGRAFLGDLPGSEKAFRHAQRLMDRCEGSRRHSLALFNLAEIRLRRGKLQGVREALELASGDNLSAGHLRGSNWDDELWARYEMVSGRPSAALRHVRRALDRLGDGSGNRSGDGSGNGSGDGSGEGRENGSGHGRQHEELRVLEARALGWLGRAAEAAGRLEGVGAGAVAILEPEERPAVFALAGLQSPALEQASGTPMEGWWFGLLSGDELGDGDWRLLETLEPYRAARLVHDAELLFPGAAPARWRRRAAEAFYRVGATGQARILEARDHGPWKALEAHLRVEEPSPEHLESLFHQAGYGNARLFWQPVGGAPELVWGSGDGGVEMSEELSGGRLVLRTGSDDAVVRALFRLVIRSFRRRRRPRRKSTAHGILGESARLQKALARLEKVAPSSMPVLILGESGTGKELVARHLHQRSERRDGPFLALNCAALSETLVLSDLFGHVRGSFTGADRDRAGIFESAREGTVFLDEIGDLPLSAQGNLLRVLQEGEIRRLGESQSRKVDVRIVAATHRGLTEMVNEKTFRQDLYYRLRVGSVSLPPLRDRGRDVLLLAETFLDESPGDLTLSAEAKAALLAHPWPGNVRELRNVIQLASTLAEGPKVLAEHLDLPEVAVETTDYHQSLASYRRGLIREALDSAGGNRAEAARRLGLSRQALSYQINQLGLHWPPGETSR